MHFLFLVLVSFSLFAVTKAAAVDAQNFFALAVSQVLSINQSISQSKPAGRPVNDRFRTRAPPKPCAVLPGNNRCGIPVWDIIFLNSCHRSTKPMKTSTHLDWIYQHSGHKRALDNKSQTSSSPASAMLGTYLHMAVLQICCNIKCLEWNLFMLLTFCTIPCIYWDVWECFWVGAVCCVMCYSLHLDTNHPVSRVTSAQNTTELIHTYTTAIFFSFCCYTLHYSKLFHFLDPQVDFL